MKKRNKTYRPKQVVRDVLAYILQGNLPASAAQSTMIRVRIANHGAMDSLIRGVGVPQDVITLDHMLITAKALAAAIGIGAEYLQALKDAHAALHDINRRGGRPVLRASEIKALNLAIEIHDAQLETCSVKELEDAINAAKNALRCGHEVKEIA